VTQNAIVADANAVKALADIIQKSTGLQVVEITAPGDGEDGLPDAITVGVKPNGETVNLRPLFENWRTRPERKTGTAEAQTLATFKALLSRHRTAASVVFADTAWKAPSFTAIIDYHAVNGEPDNARHRVRYAFPLSDEWRAWVEANGKPMAQAEFAAFIEDRIAELSSPTEQEANVLGRDFATRVATPSELIALSRGLQVAVAATVMNVTVLQSGEGQITFEEAHHGADGQPLKVPGLFMLQIAPFFMGETIRLPVRLRYRVKEGKVVWFFQMYRPDQFVTERIRDDLSSVFLDLGIPVFEGKPESGGAT
jgi:uncharacterized protein YfdQ (DUF2303 family)